MCSPGFLGNGRYMVHGVRVCVCVCVCVCVSKYDQALAKLEPWTAVSAYLGLISKVQSSAGA